MLKSLKLVDSSKAKWYKDDCDTWQIQMRLVRIFNFAIRTISSLSNLALSTHCFLKKKWSTQYILRGLRWVLDMPTCEIINYTLLTFFVYYA